MKLDDRGFTLIEVLLAVVIIAVLAGIALPHYFDTRARSLDATVESAVRNVATGEEAYYANRLSYASTIDDLDGIVSGGVAITLVSGNSGDFNSSFRVRGTLDGAAHAFEWVSDPAPGDPHLFEDAALAPIPAP